MSQDFDVFPGQDEVVLLHALALVPVDECPFAEHQVELVAQARPRARYGRRVRHHAHGPAAAHQLVVGRHCGHGRSAVDAHLEPGRTPLDELQALGVADVPYRVVDVLCHHVAAIQHAARDVLAGGVFALVELEQLVAGLETSGGQVDDGRPLVRGPLGGRERSVRQQREVHSRERHQVGLELVNVDVQRAREPERRGDGRHHLADDAVQVWVHGPFHVQFAGADVVYRLVVHHERAVGRVQRLVRHEQRVVRFHHGRGHLGCRVHEHLQVALLRVVLAQAFRHKTGQARPRAATHRVEHDEPLHALAGLGEQPDALQHLLQVRPALRVVAAREVVGRVLLAGYQLVRVVQAAVGPRPDLIHHRRLQVNHDRPRYVLAGHSFLVERRVFRRARVVHRTRRRRQTPVPPDPVLHPVKVPHCVSHLHAGLSNVHGDHLTFQAVHVVTVVFVVIAKDRPSMCGGGTLVSFGCLLSLSSSAVLFAFFRVRCVLSLLECCLCSYVSANIIKC